MLVNGSQLTRLYSIEEGLGYGRIRLSVLFRPVEAKLPLNLLGFDTGTLEVRDLSVKLSQDLPLDLSKCEVRLKTTKAGADEKVSRRNAHRRDDGSVQWESDDNLTRIPVRTRYGSALLMSFKDSSSSLGVKRAGRKALAVLWLRDIADNDEGVIELPLWNVTDGDYSRLKMNYSPPDGNLDVWDDDKKKVRRVGSVRVHLVFKPGISDLHRNLLNGGGPQRKEAWEAFTREVEGGLRDTVGEPGGEERNPERRPEDLAGKRRGSENSADSQSTEAAQAQPARGGSNERCDEDQQDDDAQHSQMSMNKDASAPDINTVVSSDAVENESIEHHSEHVEDDDSSEANASDDGNSGKKGVVGKLKEWKQHEKELHMQHRGIMQAKPARTAEWIKDNVEEGAHHIKDRFSMKTRKPAVETEI